MSQRAAFLLQVLENLGAPLMAAVSAVSLRPQAADDAPAQSAERVAELLARSVQVSVALSGTAGLSDGGDSVRLALAALAARLLGNQYRQTGNIPQEADIKRLTDALGAVLTFSDNFSPAADNTARLENLAPGMILADESQIGIQYIGLFVPIVNVVTRFPFGQPEKKLLQDIAGRLVAAATDIRQRTIGDSGDAKAQKQAELNILHGLTTLYVSCHSAETDRLMAMDENARGQAQSINAVWEAFEKGTAMLEILAQNAVPDDGSVSTATGNADGPAPAAQQQPAPPAAPPPAQEETKNKEDDANYNPMSFFKPPDKKGTEEI